jgi:hypothetical protein
MSPTGADDRTIADILGQKSVSMARHYSENATLPPHGEIGYGSSGPLLTVANWPYTLFGIMPTNNRLMAIDPSDSGPSSRALIKSWGKLHGDRSALGALAVLTFLAAALVT